MQLGPLPSECLVDHALVIRVRGLSAGAQLTARLYNAGPNGSVFLSHATFVADAEGVVDFACQAPVSGSYQGVDAMGLFWSRVLVTRPEAAACSDASKDPFTLTLKLASDDGSEPISHTLKRTFAASDVRSHDVREDGLFGRMFEPAQPGARSAILVVGGSNGGLVWSQEMAALLASHGHAAFALAYFGAEGLPATLDRIPLEYFGTALAWLAAQPGVDGNRIAVMGLSRGGELALLIAATFPSVRAVVAYVPSAIAWPAFPASGHGAWTLEGKEVAYASTLTHEEWDKALADGTARKDSLDWYLIPLRDAGYTARVSIPVERIGGPVLMISGADDRLWPSTALTEIAVQRLRNANFPHPVEHLIYPEAGHSSGWPHVPTTQLKSKHSVSGEDIDMGGTPEGTARARQDAWPRMLAFLQTALPGG